MNSSTQSTNFGNQTDSADSAVHPDIDNILATLLGGLLIICTLIGNCLVCISFYLFKELRTVCHYFVISLSAADILVAMVAMPFWCALQVTSHRWIFSVGLRTFWNCMDILCGTASIMNLTAVSIDRHAAITDPFSYPNVMTSTRAISMIVFVWLYSILVSGLRLASWPIKSSYMHFVSATSFFIPLFVMIIMYTRIYLVARQQVHRLRNGHTYARDVKAAKTIAILIGLFVVCWGPFFAIILCFAYDQSFSVPPLLFNVIKWIEYTSSFLNPIIYTSLNRSYRRAFRKLCHLVRNKRDRADTFASTDSRSRAGNSSFTGSTVEYDSSVERTRRRRNNSFVLDCVRSNNSQT